MIRCYMCEKWKSSKQCLGCGWDEATTIFDFIAHDNHLNGIDPKLTVDAIADRTTRLAQAATMLMDQLTQLQLSVTTQMLEEKTKQRVLRWSLLLLFETLQTGYALDIPLEEAFKSWYMARQRGTETETELNKIKW